MLINGRQQLTRVPPAHAAKQRNRHPRDVYEHGLKIPYLLTIVSLVNLQQGFPNIFVRWQHKLPHNSAWAGHFTLFFLGHRRNFF